MAAINPHLYKKMKYADSDKMDNINPHKYKKMKYADNKNDDDDDCKGAFYVYPKDQFLNKFPFYREPKEFGFFSQLNLKDQSPVYDKQSLNNLWLPQTQSPNPTGNNSPSHVNVMPLENIRKLRYSCDLNEGLSNYITKEAHAFGRLDLDDLLQWVLAHVTRFEIPRNISFENSSGCKSDHNFKFLNTDFICWRGLLTKLLCTPYENFDPWIIAVTKFNGTFYLCEYETEKRTSERANMSVQQKKMEYWGHKFEHYLTTEKPNEPPKNLSRTVTHDSSFCTVVRSRLESHSLVFAGEVDCIDVESKESNKYVELKTSRIIENQRMMNTFKRHKSLKWWAQSYLPGIRTIICGFRDDDGIVHHLESFKVQDLPKQADGWDPAICFNFLNKFLDFLKQKVTVDDPRTVYVCRWYPKEDITLQKEPENSKYMFLPDWFITAMT